VVSLGLELVFGGEEGEVEGAEFEVDDGDGEG
jgi:hypothetical protein